MVSLNVVLTVKNDTDIAKVRELLAKQGAMSRQEPGCLRFEVYHSDSDPMVFILNERWESEVALEVHRGAGACETVYKPQVLPLVERTAHVCTIVEPC